MSKLSAATRITTTVPQNIETIYKDDLWENAIVQAEFLETPGKDIDFDQINEENMTYSRYGGT